MLSAAEKLAAEVGNDVGQRPKSRRAPSANGVSVFDEANKVDTIALLDRLLITHESTNRGEMARCPGCAEYDSLVCKDGGLKCFHERCSAAGPPANPGFRTNVDLVMHAEELDKLEAAKLICQWFGIAVPKGTKKAATPEPPPEDDYTPSDEDDPQAPPTSEDTGNDCPQPQAKPKSRIELIDPAAIFAPLEKPDYVIDRVIRRGSLTQLVGYGGGFKTWTALGSVLSVGSGLDWLGRFPVKQGRAVYLDYENGQYEMRRRAHALARGFGLSSVENIGFGCMPPVYMSDPKFGAAVEPLADGASLLVVDTLKAANPGTDENDSNMRSGLDALRRVGEKTGCAFLVLVHSKKTSGTMMTIDPREAGRGSSAIYDAADTVLHATYVEGKPLHVQQTKARLGRPVDPFLVTITDTEDGGVVVSATDVPEMPIAAASDRFEAACVQVLEAVREWPGSSRGTLREKLGMRNGTVSAALDRLCQDGAIRNAGTKGDPKWFPLSPNGAVRD